MFDNAAITSLLVTSGLASFEVVPASIEPNEVRALILYMGLDTLHGLW